MKQLRGLRSNLELFASFYLAVSIGFVFSISVNPSLDNMLRYFGILGTIQASLLGIIIAIYILGNQIVVEQYSVRVLQFQQTDTTLMIVYFLYGLSLLSDVLGILISKTLIATNSARLYIFITSVLSTLSFLSLILIKDEMIGQSQPTNIAGLIKTSVTTDNLVQRIENKQFQNPFYNQFEAARNAAKSNDKQNRKEVSSAINQSIRNISDEIFEESIASGGIIVLYYGIINNLQDLAMISIKKEESDSVNRVVKTMAEIIQSALKHGFDGIAAKATKSIFEISKQVIPTKVQDIFVKSTWNVYSDILSQAAEENAEKTIAAGTHAVSSLTVFIEDEFSDLEPFSLKIFNVLMNSLIESWKIYLQNDGASMSVSNIMYGDSKYMEPFEFEYNYNYFEDGFSIYL